MARFGLMPVLQSTISLNWAKYTSSPGSTKALRELMAFAPGNDTVAWTSVSFPLLGRRLLS